MAKEDNGINLQLHELDDKFRAISKQIQDSGDELDDISVRLANLRNRQKSCFGDLLLHITISKAFSELLEDAVIYDCHQEQTRLASEESL